MKHRNILWVAICLGCIVATPATASRNETPVPQSSITGLHNEQYGSGVQGSHFIVNEHFTNVSNNMAKNIGIPEQYGLLDDAEDNDFEIKSRHRQQKISSSSSFKPDGVSFSQMSARN